MKKVMIAAVIATFTATSAIANDCPNDMKEIDAALKTAKLSDTDKKKVQELRKKGEDLHKAGKHADSLKTLGEAKKILKIE
jgi:hypothetical protein